MRHLKLLAAAIVLAAFRGHSGVAEQPAQAVWEGLRWGMTRQDIVARLPAARDYTLDLGNSREARLFGIPSYEVSGCIAKIAFQFRNDRLDTISLDFQLNERKYNRCDSAVEHDLRGRFGRPAAFEAIDKGLFRIERGEWLNRASEVHYHSIAAALAGSAPMLLELSVTYLPRDASAQAGKL